MLPVAQYPPPSNRGPAGKGIGGPQAGRAAIAEVSGGAAVMEFRESPAMKCFIAISIAPYPR
jgi:hypothetical protein